MGGLSSIPELGRSPGEGKGYPFQYSDLENSMDSIAHGIAESDTAFTFTLECTISLSLWLKKAKNKGDESAALQFRLSRKFHIPPSSAQFMKFAVSCAR